MLKTKNVVMLVLMASVAVAQTSGAKPSAAKTVVVPASQTVTAKPAVAKKSPVSTSAKAKAPKPVVAKAIAQAAENDLEKEIKPGKSKGRRDPFVNPVKLQAEKMSSAPSCTTGARCLMIDQVVLKGVVKTQAGMIAMVENSAKKQYNLREKDPVFNGFVQRITGDSVVFKENTMDNMGRSTTREVVKRVTVPVV
jgi:hypothetical protein